MLPKGAILPEPGGFWSRARMFDIVGAYDQIIAGVSTYPILKKAFVPRRGAQPERILR
jgi:hypothetical protein